MNKYETNGILREDKIDNVDRWYWSKTDQQTYHIIKQEWPVHKQTVLDHVPNRRVCVQAGGNMGMYPRLYADMFETVYTFEPDPENFFFLSTNCQEDNIIKLQAALGAHHQTGMLSVNRVYEPNPGMHKVEESQKGNVPIIRLDNMGLPACDLIHLDVEGYELLALQGAVMVIKQFKPLIMAERYENPEEIIDFLKPVGYVEVGYSAHDLVMKYNGNA